MDERAMEQRDKNFNEWRKGQSAIMPQIAARVFALRERFYVGCGFHYGLERLLGTVLRELNDYENFGYYHTNDAIARQISLLVFVQNLYADIVKAEGSAVDWEAGRRGNYE